MLYEYFSNTLNPIIDRRNFDELDSHLGKRSIDTDPDRYSPKRFFLERPRALPTAQDQQQKQVSYMSLFCTEENLREILLQFIIIIEIKQTLFA